MSKVQRATFASPLALVLLFILLLHAVCLVQRGGVVLATDEVDRADEVGGGTRESAEVTEEATESDIPVDDGSPPIGVESRPGEDEEEEVNVVEKSTRRGIPDAEVIYISSLDDISRLLQDPMSDSGDVQSPALQSYLEYDPEVTFVLTLVYSTKCAASQQRFDQFTHEVPKLWKEKNVEGDPPLLMETSLPPPVLVLLSVDAQDPEKHLTEHIESFGITHVPALIWMVCDSNQNTFVLDYAAVQAHQNLTASGILQSFRHLQSRLLWLSSEMEFDDATGAFRLEPRYFSASKMMADPPQNETVSLASPLETWLAEHGEHVFQSTAPAFFASLSETESNYGQWLWYQEGPSAHDGYLVLGQCRTAHDGENVLLDTFDRLKSTWINRRDLIMVGINDCPNADLDTGKKYLWRIQPAALRDGTLDLSWEAAEREIVIGVPQDNAPESMKNTLVGATTPTVLWLDRQTSAPIAFPTWRKVHAVLVVNLHRAAGTHDGTLTPLDTRQAQALKRFRRVCREHQRNPLTEDVVCLVVPSTDVRTLTIFGIDIWTPMDLVAWQPTEGHGDPEILPVGFITDQRFGGTRRYYIDRDELDSDDIFADFWMRFWEGTLQPFPKTSETTRTNKAGIRIITASDFESEVLGLAGSSPSGLPEQSIAEQRSSGVKHALVLFTSNSCGHCRRLMALWDEFGRLVEKLDWSGFVTLYLLDVSTNEILASDAWNHTVRWVPDLVYVSLLENRMVHYAEKDDYGDHVVGGVKSYMDLVEWFLHVADMDDGQILDLLADVRTVLQRQEATTKETA